MTQPAPSLFDYAATQRDRGIRQAIEHAETVVPDWSEIAYRWIVQYAREHRGQRFISEDVTDAAREAGISSPTDSRAWGHPFRKAAKAGIIKRVGYGVSARRHLSPTPMWEAQ